MNRRIKQAMMAQRRRRSDGTYMEEPMYMEPWARSGSFGVNPDGTEYPIYPNTMEMARKRDSRGRFTSRYDGFPGKVEPVYRDTPKNRIGFSAPTEVDPKRYGTRADMHHMDESAYRTSEKHMGYADSSMEEPMSKEAAMEWTKSMKNADGTSGPHWTMEQTEQIREQQKIQCDKAEFFATINMMYSDYCKVAKKFNVSTMEFYAAMAKAFLDDKDAEPGKLMRYYDYIVEK